MDGFNVRRVEVIGSTATNYQLAWIGNFDGNSLKDFLWFDPTIGSAVIWECSRKRRSAGRRADRSNRPVSALDIVCQRRPLGFVSLADHARVFEAAIAKSTALK